MIYINNVNNVGWTLQDTIMGSYYRFISYLPQLIGGIIILLIGLIIASALKELTLRLLRMLKVREWFGASRVDTVAGNHIWPEILGEVVRWTVIILFLIPAVEAWGLPRITEVLNQVLLYIPNVLVAVVVGFVGFGLANVVSRLVHGATDTLGSESATLLSHIARYALIFFTVLVVLNQLGIASDLIRILFTGIVAMLAIAGGLAFGLGGQDSAKQFIARMQRKLSEGRPTSKK